MKGEGKMVFFKSKMKWVGLLGIFLSVFSLFTHFLLARYTEGGVSQYQASITIFSWRPIFENSDLSPNVTLLKLISCTSCTFSFNCLIFAVLLSSTLEIWVPPFQQDFGFCNSCALRFNYDSRFLFVFFLCLFSLCAYFLSYLFLCGFVFCFLSLDETQMGFFVSLPKINF